MKCRGKRDTTVHKLFCVVSRFLRYISCYIAENNSPFGHCTVWAPCRVIVLFFYSFLWIFHRYRDKQTKYKKAKPLQKLTVSDDERAFFFIQNNLIVANMIFEIVANSQR